MNRKKQGGFSRFGLLIMADDITIKIKKAAGRLMDAASCYPADGIAQYYSLNSKWYMPSINLAGEIIPLFYDLSEFLNDETYRKKACELAELIMDKKFRTVENLYTLPVFQASQIMSGLLEFYKHESDDKALYLIVKIAEWLASIQDPDGKWKYIFEGEKEIRFLTYDTRSAYVLLELWKLTGISRFYNCADKNIKFVLSQQLSNGWYRNNSPYPEDEAELRYIAYVMNSVLWSGIILEDKRYINSAKICADTLIKMQNNKGDLPVKYNKLFHPVATKTCCAGNAQIAIALFDLFEVCEDQKYLESALRINKSLCEIQNTNSDSGKIGGAILSERGSRIYSSYATMYFIRSLLKHYEMVLNEGESNR